MHIKLYTTSRPQRIQQVADEWALGRKRGGYTLDWDWFLDYFSKENEEGLVFHFTPYYRKKWGLNQNLNGSRNTKYTRTPVFWVCANVGEEAARRDGPGYPPEITELHRLLYHEMAHFDEDQDDLVGDRLNQESVHILDYEANAIHRYPELVNYTTLSLLQRIRRRLVELTYRLFEKLSDADETYVHPVGDRRAYISQAYGIENALYKKTSRHIGTDYAIPVGTKLYAPRDCQVTATGSHNVLGNWCIIRYELNGTQYEERWLHLQAAPTLGQYRQGTVVARSGNTGLSTGPHLHREVHYNEVRIDLINKSSWSRLTLDPELMPWQT